MTKIDIALTEGPDGKALAHRLDCPVVAEHREQGRPLATLFGIEELPSKVARHECLDQQ